MRVGIVGTKWGLMHVGGFRAAGCDVVGVCGQDQARVAEIANREHIAFATDSVEALCRHVDLIVVASPDALHAAHSITGLTSGIHVLSEKPMTRTLDEAIAVLRAASERVEQVFAVSYAFRFLDSMTRLKAWLSSQSPVRRIQASLRSGFVESVDASPDGTPHRLGASGDFGGLSHGIDAALWLADDRPRTVQAHLQGFPAHSVGLLIETTRGVAIHLSHLAVSHPSNPGSWVLAGDDWKVRFEAGYRPDAHGWIVSPVEAFWRGHLERTVLVNQVSPIPGQREPWAQAHVEVARAMCARIRGTKESPLPTGAEAFQTQLVLDAALRSEAQGERIVIPERHCPGR
jgi:predicted dehydrogenase